MESSDLALFRLAALVSEQVRPERISPEEWPQIIRLSLAHGLAPMLWWLAGQAGLPVQSEPGRFADDRLWEPVQQESRVAVFRSLSLQASCMSVQKALTREAIPAIWLKGVALASTVYPEAHLRPMLDLDVLVPYAQRQRALAAAESLGYRLRPGDLLGSTPELSHHYALWDSGATRFPLEIHYRLLSVARETWGQSLARLSWFWQPEQLWQWQAGFTTLSPEAHLIYLAAHALAHHGEADLSLLRIFDLHRLVTQNRLDWQIVLDQTATLGWVEVVERALTLTSQFFATPVPAGVFEKLRLRGQSAGAGAPALKLLPVGNHWDRLRYRSAGLSLRERMRLVRVVLFPPPFYMRQRYQVAPGHSVWPYYFRRWFEQWGEISHSLWARLKR